MVLIYLRVSVDLCIQYLYGAGRKGGQRQTILLLCRNSTTELGCDSQKGQPLSLCLTFKLMEPKHTLNCLPGMVW